MRPSYVYTLHANAEAPAFASIPSSSPAGLDGYNVALVAAIRELSGREPGPWLGKNLHRKGRCYIAANRSGTIGGRGFIVARTDGTNIDHSIGR